MDRESGTVSAAARAGPAGLGFSSCFSCDLTHASTLMVQEVAAVAPATRRCLMDHSTQVAAVARLASAARELTCGPGWSSHTCGDLDGAVELDDARWRRRAAAADERAVRRETS